MNLRIALLVLVFRGSASAQTEPCRAAVAALASEEHRLDVDLLGLANQGASAVAPLTDLLSCDSELVRSNAARMLGGFGAPAAPATLALAKLLRDPAWEVRAAAATAIAHVGVFPDTALALLAATLGDPRPEVAYACADAHYKAGAASIPVLLLSLQDTHPSVRLVAASALARTGRSLPEALPMLLEMLGEDPTTLRIAALHVLRNLDSKLMEDVVPTLFPLLDDPALRCEAARVIAAGGGTQARRVALPVLLEVLANADEVDGCASLAATELAAIGPAAVPGLERVIERGTPVAGRHAVSALAAFEPPTRTSLEALGRVLSHRELAANAADALARLGARAVPVLTHALDADAHISRREASWALARIGRPADAAVPALVRRLHLEAGDEKQALIVALGRIGGERARAAIPDLRRALADPSARRQAAGALARIQGADAADVIPVLVDALRVEVRGMCPHPAANEELEAIGTPAISALVALLSDPGFESKYWVLAILDRQGSASLEAARPVLLEWLESGIEGLGFEAAIRLARIPVDESTRDRIVLLLERALGAPSPWVRLQGAEQLVRMGRADSPLVETALRELEDHRFNEVRVRARSALAGIERAH